MTGPTAAITRDTAGRRIIRDERVLRFEYADPPSLSSVAWFIEAIRALDGGNVSINLSGVLTQGRRVGYIVGLDGDIGCLDADTFNQHFLSSHNTAPAEDGDPEVCTATCDGLVIVDSADIMYIDGETTLAQVREFAAGYNKRVGLDQVMDMEVVIRHPDLGLVEASLLEQIEGSLLVVDFEEGAVVE